MVGIRSLLEELLSPVVAVISSPEADSIVQNADGLTIAELCRPFGHFLNLNAGVGGATCAHPPPPHHHTTHTVPVRTVGDTSYRVHQLKLRFFAADTMHPLDSTLAEQHLQRTLHTAAAAYENAPVTDIRQHLAQGPVALQTPWYSTYLSEFLRTLLFDDAQSCDAPVACMFVLPSTVDDPVAAFTAMVAQQRHPLLVAALQEPRLPRHYVLLHDHASNPDPSAFKRAEEQVRLMRATFGSVTCHLLRIHTPLEEDVKGTQREGAWRRHLHSAVQGAPGGCIGESSPRPPTPEGGLGAAISAADMVALRQMVEEFTVRSLLPSLEQRVRVLSQTVAAQRKGLRNQLKTLLWRKAADGGTTAPSYDAGSLESQMHQLAVLAFLLQDYETSASTLRMLCSDYRQDKSMRHLAFAQELLGLAVYYGAGRMNDATNALYDAAKYFMLAGTPANPRMYERQHGRCMMMLGEMCRDAGLYRDAHTALMSAHTEAKEAIRAAVTLEQGSNCLLSMQPPFIRRFAFYTVLTAIRYRQAGFASLSAKGYALAQQLYCDTPWCALSSIAIAQDLVDEHVQESLAKHCMEEQGDPQGALPHYMAVLRHPSSTLAAQTQHMTKFLEAVLQSEEAAKRKLPLQLPLPVMDPSRAIVRCGGQTSYAQPEARAVPESAWSAMEVVLQPTDPSDTPAVGVQRAKPSLVSVPLSGTCVAGETVAVDLQLTNPLALPLECGFMRLLVDHWEGTPGGLGTQEVGGSDDVLGRPLADRVEVVEVDVSIAPRTTKTVTLHVVPKVEGVLTIRGVAWLLQGVAQGYLLLDASRHNRRITRATKGTSKSTAALQQLASMASSLHVQVLPPMPLLTVAFQRLPKQLLQGQLCTVHLALTNEGSSPLGRIALVTGLGGLVANEGPDGAACGCEMKGGFQVVTLPAGLSLAPGQSVTWPVVLHARHTGQLSLQLLWYYQPAVQLDTLRSRMLRSVLSVPVAPCLAMSASLQPCAGRVGTSIAGLRMAVAPAAPAVTLSRIGTLSTLQQLAALGGDGTWSTCLEPAMCLEPSSKATTLFYVATQPVQEQSDPSEALAQGTPLTAAQWTQLVTQEQAHHAAQGAVTPGRSGIDLAAVWQSDGGLWGLQLLHGLAPQEPASVWVSVQGKLEVVHDFKGPGPCTTTLQVHVLNCGEACASVFLETGVMASALLSPKSPTAGRGAAASRVRRSNSSVSAGGHLVFADTLMRASSIMPSPGYEVASCPAYAWCGATHANLAELAPGEAGIVDLTLAFFAPGVYEVSDYAVSWNVRGQSTTQSDLQPCPPVVVRVVAAGL